MAIVIAGIIGGVVGGTIAAGKASMHGDYSAHSAYSDYENRRRIAEQNARKQRNAEERQRRNEARTHLDEIIESKVSSFENREGVSGIERVSIAECGFKDFNEDMKPMNDSAKKVIHDQVASELRKAIQQDQERLKELDELIQTVNERILSTPSKK